MKPELALEVLNEAAGKAPLTRVGHVKVHEAYGILKAIVLQHTAAQSPKSSTAGPQRPSMPEVEPPPPPRKAQ